jgi:ankyrin repeat protein
MECAPHSVTSGGAAPTKKQHRLHDAAVSGHAVCLARLLRAESDKRSVDSRDFGGRTIAYLAVYHGHPECLRLLRRCGATLGGHHTPQGDTLLGTASRCNFVACVEELVDAGLDPDTLDGSGWSPLNLAILHGHASCVAVLVAAGADVAFPPPVSSARKHHSAVAFAVKRRNAECLNALKLTRRESPRDEGDI